MDGMGKGYNVGRTCRTEFPLREFVKHTALSLASIRIFFVVRNASSDIWKPDYYKTEDIFLE